MTKHNDNQITVTVVTVSVCGSRTEYVGLSQNKCISAHPDFGFGRWYLLYFFHQPLPPLFSQQEQGGNAPPPGGAWSLMRFWELMHTPFIAIGFLSFQAPVDGPKMEPAGALGLSAT